MKIFAAIAMAAAFAATSAYAQKKTSPPGKRASVASPRPRGADVPASVPVKKGTEATDETGRRYTNREFGFEVTFPVTWLIPGDDFESEMKKAGFDLSLNPPANVSSVDQIRMNRALQRVKILLTAYRSMPGSEDNAIVRISTEDLSSNPQIQDAVDYFDAMRAQFAAMKLPADFRYSETGAEQLGKHQFGYIDTSSDAGKKRIYATVRKRHAILFSISYTMAEDLKVLKQVLAEGSFTLK